MGYAIDGAAERRLERYVEEIGEILGHKLRRASFGHYFLGLLSEGERKSVEPIAARAAGSPEGTRAMTEAISAREPIQDWIVDDTGFIKQGCGSPGVQRQYTGRARIPDELGFRPKWRIALDLIEAAVIAHLPRGLVLGDAAYGTVGELRVSGGVSPDLALPSDSSAPGWDLGASFRRARP